MQTQRYQVTFIRRDGGHRYGRTFHTYSMATAWAARHMAADIAAIIEPIVEVVLRWTVDEEGY